jgi:hypothetical protein
MDIVRDKIVLCHNGGRGRSLSTRNRIATSVRRPIVNGNSWFPNTAVETWNCACWDFEIVREIGRGHGAHVAHFMRIGVLCGE